MYLKYIKYLLRHKLYVFCECYKYGIILRGIFHDFSKFYPDEFIAYARYFYGNYPDWNDVKRNCPGYSYKYTKQGVEKAFDLAWLKHQHRNRHHWQYYLLREDDGGTKVLDIPTDYLYEMVADWKGAGRAITGKNDPEECKKWYIKNYQKIKLSENSRTRVNNILGKSIK